MPKLRGKRPEPSLTPAFLAGRVRENSHVTWLMEIGANLKHSGTCWYGFWIFLTSPFCVDLVYLAYLPAWYQRIPIIQAAVKWSRTRLEILFISFVLKRSSSPPRMFNTHGFGIESTRRRFLPGCCKKHDRRGMGGVLADQTPADFDETLATSADHSPAFSLTSVAPRKTVRQLALTPALTGF